MDAFTSDAFQDDAFQVEAAAPPVVASGNRPRGRRKKPNVRDLAEFYDEEEILASLLL